jgi:Uma2 family endonuclease
MSVVLEKESEGTMEELVERLGGIPLIRIRCNPAPGTAVEQDVIDIRNTERRIFELVDGVLVEKPMGYMESAIAAVIITELSNFLRETKAGIVTGEAGMMRLTRGLVRIPDVSVVLWERIPGRKFPKEPIPTLAPDLAVEVLSKSNTAAEIDRKLREYFAAGCRCAWVVDPDTRSVRVYSDPESSVLLHGDQLVKAEAVLPGFEISVSDIFRRSGLE